MRYPAYNTVPFFSKVITKKEGGYSDKKKIRVSCFRMMIPYMKFQNSNFHGSKVTNRHRTRDTYIQTYTNSSHPPTHTPKAVCPSSFFKVKSGAKQGDSLRAIRERIRALGRLSNSIYVVYHFDTFAPWAISVLQAEINWAIIISRNFVNQRKLSTNIGKLK